MTVWPRDAGKTTLADGTEARMVKLHFPAGGPKEAEDNYWLVTIRSDNNVLEKAEWFVQGKPILVIRRGKAGPSQAPSMGWDLAGLAKPAATTATTPGPSVMFGMVVPDVTVEHMVKKADFTTYVFSKAPSWAGERQITDILDVASPPHRMFFITYRAKDGRHVVLMQSFSYNKAASQVKEDGQSDLHVAQRNQGVEQSRGPVDGQNTAQLVRGLRSRTHLARN